MRKIWNNFWYTYENPSESRFGTIYGKRFRKGRLIIILTCIPTYIMIIKLLF